MNDTMTISQVGLRKARTYNQVLNDVLRGRLRGFQDERGRWRVYTASVLQTEGGETGGAQGAE
jgi:hypothetical protein